MAEVPGESAAWRVPAVVLAGGRTGAAFAAAAGVDDRPGYRALADVGGVPMVRRVLTALQRAGTIGRVVLAAPAGFPEQPEADEQVTVDGGLPESVASGLARCGGAEFALIVTADLPFLSAASVDDYVRTAARMDADCCYAAVCGRACRKTYPGLRRTCVNLCGRRYTGGNVVLQRVSAFPRQAEALRQAYRRRKNPLFLAGLIGPASALRLLTGRLRLEDIERAASRLMGVRCRLVPTERADLGTDVDRPGDLLIARAIAAAGGVPSG